jgi:hypothetical protein
VKIGEKYFFPNALGDKGMAGTVTAVSVDENKKEVIVAVSDDSQTALLKYPLTDSELAEWKEFGDAIFGKESRRTKTHCENEFDLFEFFMDAYKELPRDELLKRCANSGPGLEKMKNEELLMLYCEAMVASVPGKGSHRDDQISGSGWLLKAVLGPDGKIQLWDIFINNNWVGSRRTKKQCYEVIGYNGLNHPARR